MDYRENVNEMLQYRGFIHINNDVYANVNDHKILALYIIDKDEIDNNLKEIHDFLTSQGQILVTHILIYYTLPGKLKKLKEGVSSFLNVLNDNFYYEIFNNSDFNNNPINSIYSPDDITIYPPGTAQSNTIYSAMSRFATIDNVGELNTNRILLSDPLVKYLNLQVGSVVIIKNDRGYTSRISNMHIKILVVVNKITELSELYDINSSSERKCNCTNYNDLFVLNYIK